MKHLGIHLKKIREKLNISQTEMAESLGFKKQYLSNIENGNKGLSKKTITLLQEKYNVSPNYLLTGEGPIFLGEPDNEILKELSELSEMVEANPGILMEILTVVMSDTDLMHYAALAVKGDKNARNKFLKLTE